MTNLVAIREELARITNSVQSLANAAIAAVEERDLLRIRVDSLDAALRDRRARIEDLERELEQAQTRAAAAEAELASRAEHDDDDNDERNPR